VTPTGLIPDLVLARMSLILLAALIAFSGRCLFPIPNICTTALLLSPTSSPASTILSSSIFCQSESCLKIKVRTPANNPSTLTPSIYTNKPVVGSCPIRSTLVPVKSTLQPFRRIFGWWAEERSPKKSTLYLCMRFQSCQTHPV